jgi:serine/threonine protein kinase
VFVLCTDGVHGSVTPAAIAAAIDRHAGNLDVAARAIADEALSRGSDDNLTVQVVRVEALPDANASEVSVQAAALAPPPPLEPRMVIDGYRVVRELHGSSRSHLHLAVDEATQATLVLKTPSIDMGEDAGYRERFLLEEWIARRVDSPHLLKAFPSSRQRTALYIVMEFVDGRTLAQWMIDHPRPSLAEVRGIVDQIARGLRALHRAETIHQDLRPENVLVDASGTVKIIDFGAARVAGLMDMRPTEGEPLPGTAQYMAPEFFLGGQGSEQSDLYSLAVITWQMLTGRLPYGLEMPKCRSLAQQKKLRLRSLHEWRADIPAWVDAAIGKALHPEPHRRWGDVAEFVHALHQPDAALVGRRRLPLIERDPLVFWKSLSLLLALACVALAGLLLGSSG